MEFIRPVHTEVLIMCGLFIVAYIAYVSRLIYIQRRLQTSISNFWWKLVIRTIYFTLIIIAVMGPSFGASNREIKAVGKDIFIAVDLSESMNAEDIQPSRLKKIKFELKKIIHSFSSDRIGLIIFSSEAFLQCPLTYDQNALNMFIEILHTGLVPNAGTDFGPPLEMALEKLNSEQTSVTQQKSKIIVLISDGEDFGDDTAEAVEEINDQDIRLFALGVGTERGSRIPTRNGYKRDGEGKEVVTRLSSTSLQEIASETEGDYFEINEGTNDVERLINSIINIEGEVRDVKQVDVTTDKYFYFLLIAVGFILLDALLNIRVVKI